MEFWVICGLRLFYWQKYLAWFNASVPKNILFLNEDCGVRILRSF